MSTNTYTSQAPRRPAMGLSRRNVHPTSAISSLVSAAEIIIGITLHNQATTIRSALESALMQSVVESGMAAIVILDDESDDEWRSACADLLNDPRIATLSGCCGTAARARNALLDYVDEHLPGAKWVARLDADDALAFRDSVERLWSSAIKPGTNYILGSNYLQTDNKILPWINVARTELIEDQDFLLAYIEDFCHGRQEQELPSCNLILRSRSGIRYPDVRSAEDHWLVASLLVFRPDEGVVTADPVYSVYSLNGRVSLENRQSSDWSDQRKRLATAARIWVTAKSSGHTVLGHGQEGIVILDKGQVRKVFYPWAMTLSDAEQLRERLDRADLAVCPRVDWHTDERGLISCTSELEDMDPIESTLTEQQVLEFLRVCFRSGLVVSNISRANLRIAKDGTLRNIDVGRDIAEFSTSRFIDSAARLYSIGILGHADQELLRRKTLVPQHVALKELPGFEEFYRGLIESLFPHCSLTQDPAPCGLRVEHPDTTLLIKTCAQDAEVLEEQVTHIVTQLCSSTRFPCISLSIDPHRGPYLRQFTDGDWNMLLAKAARLRTAGLIDQVWIAPDAKEAVTATYQRWFGDSSISETHTAGGAPLHAQLWAFDQVKTRFVLQCDLDVLIGRRDPNHDFLQDMKVLTPTEN